MYLRLPSSPQDAPCEASSPNRTGPADSDDVAPEPTADRFELEPVDGSPEDAESPSAIA
jgi:hypothetical protein